MLFHRLKMMYDESMIELITNARQITQKKSLVIHYDAILTCKQYNLLFLMAQIKLMKQIFSFLFLICCATTLTAQENESLVESNGKVFLDLKNISFIKNNEYFNPIVEGYTLIGSFLRPVITYAPSEKFEISAGMHQQIYSGEPFSIKPQLLLSTRWKVTRNSTLTLGAFDGGNKHRMFDPHFDSERIYTSYTENGASFVTETGKLFSDLWLNWENFIFRGDTVREVFTAGESFSYKCDFIDGFISLNIPVQLKFKHFGGQISNYNGHVLTFLNIAGGARLNFNIGAKAGVPGVEYLHFVYRELTGKGDMGITEGNASWLRLHYSYRSLYIGSYFWFSHNFYAPDGNQIYGSVSDYQPGYIISRRKIWTGAVYLNLFPHELFEFMLGFEGYYDFNLKRMDTAIALHINFDRRITLFNIKE